jgi:hypothetical protein
MAGSDSEKTKENNDMDGGAVLQDSSKTPRPRSEVPYPYYPLAEGIRVADAVQKAGGNEALEDEVLKQLGLDSKDARAWTYRLSSAREFGLVSRSGRGPDARIKVSDLAKRILMPTGPDEFASAKLQAFNEPVLYKRLIERFNGAPMPESRGLANLLKREFGILDNVVEIAAQAFITTARDVGAVNVAGYLVPQTQRVPVAPAVSSQAEPTQEPLSASDSSRQQATPLPDVPEDFIVHTYQLRRDLLVKLPLPGDITKKDVDRLYRWLQTLPIEDEQVA